MVRPFFTVRYNRVVLVLIAFLAISAALDTVFWHRTTHRLEATANTALTNARKNGWTVETTPLCKGGWPLGAWVELDRLNATHPASSEAPYDAGWAGEHIRLGGSWATLLRQGVTISMSGHQAARLVQNGNVLTALAPAFQIRAKNPDNLFFSAPKLDLTLSGLWPEKHISLNALSGRLIRFPKALSGATRLGLSAQTKGVIGFPLPYGLSTDLRNVRLAIALTASNTPKTRSLLDPASYGRLLLQEASASPTSSAPGDRIGLSGALDLPDANGALTLTLTGWHDLTVRLLDQPQIESHLSPDLQTALQTLLKKMSVTPGLRERPLSLSVPVINGRMTPDAQAFSTLLNSESKVP
ncbi:DUF2125 domain-containing protein [Gluconobacter roseus]|uniref:DUF2125 domain-containing protein n=1 Tax=Gluconobacter roseus NBRC 3990 TaxID=1307950 RepID=A0A4Y3MEG7_9PROT|nr:DUF2125 domain-containing protein [Gluconobacter roseus]KXV43487.1 hypothetical protein AD943_07530 [Gluconobacter roseus]GBR46784.1 hypothetical protein AA3990_1554 [Gluconobacter roseus NBRC 3990]GEB04789.1 hypothetical protein GRO01_23650 [Gluconobacter roseus NBRC 3990]GLP92076.1 hypothetical protein GCM10007871_00540 [Gluconobacter roseus NBRC 3990]